MIADRWRHIQDLDPEAELDSTPSGLWRVTLPVLWQDALEGRASLQVPPARTAQEAIERAWGRLLSLSEAGILHRDVGRRGIDSRRVRWTGTEWVLE